ncbi:MAG: hypothetical protein Q8909_09095 [Bacteroidota bacterium]|nr:hypothetical protein [Bacteroidota bacterium]
MKNRRYKKLIQKPYNTFEGKTIRQINIQTLDPFGYSIADTSIKPQTILSKTGNMIHVKTQRFTIRNLLLVRENQTFDSLLVKESERLVRSRGYVTDVSFFVKKADNSSDSVDIFIRELDKWSIIPDLKASNTHYSISLGDKNFSGLGHEFQNGFSRSITKGVNSFRTNYYIPNIRNTFISTALHYSFDGNGNFRRSLAVERPFYSPLAKWAAGVSFASQLKQDSLNGFSSDYIDDPAKLKFSTQDYWVGKAIRIFKGNTEEERVTNLILAMRYFRLRYAEKPSEIQDPLRIFSNEDFYLAAIGISTRKYVQDRYIFNFGIIEEVPIGKVYGLTGGYQVRGNSSRQYFGVRFSFGNYNEWGYLSSNVEYGTFFKASHTEQGVFTAGANYFTGLFQIGSLKFRQFVKPQLIIGIKRLPYDSLTLNSGYGLDGFKSTVLSGTRRLLLTLQTQSYLPWKLLGFRFGPYFVSSFGILGDAEKRFKKRKVYSQMGLGVLIKNENLVINTFHISISFYPVMPGVGNNILKTNTFSTTNFGFRNFEFGKPETVLYQ